MKTKEEIKEIVKKNTNLNRYPFDEFWFDRGFEIGKRQAERKIKDKFSDSDLLETIRIIIIGILTFIIIKAFLSIT